jgi:hypothetical protein
MIVVVGGVVVIFVVVVVDGVVVVVVVVVVVGFVVVVGMVGRVGIVKVGILISDNVGIFKSVPIVEAKKPCGKTSHSVAEINRTAKISENTFISIFNLPFNKNKY